MNKILLAITALIVGFGAFTFLGNKNNNQTPTKSSESMSSEKTTQTVTQPSNQIETVTLTNSGFSPKDITVKAGTRIVWLNKSGAKATVNSDDHPTHRLYPVLNLGEFANDWSVQAVFDTAGKYSYHDHLNASETGTVTVK